MLKLNFFFITIMHNQLPHTLSKYSPPITYSYSIHQKVSKLKKETTIFNSLIYVHNKQQTTLIKAPVINIQSLWDPNDYVIL